MVGCFFGFLQLIDQEHHATLFPPSIAAALAIACERFAVSPWLSSIHHLRYSRVLPLGLFSRRDGG